MSSIRRKLFKGNMTLYQIQDIAGVRAIVPSMDDLNRVAGYFEGGDTLHLLRKVNDYILEPKPDGYRSKHLVLKFVGQGKEEVFSRNFVEMQIRTRLQHAWATAVEAVGLIRGEHLKGGQGDPDWLRFFALMSGEIAYRERQPVGASVPQNRAERLKKLRDLEAKLNALNELDGYNQAIRYADEVAAAGRTYFLVTFDPVTRRVSVEPYSEFLEGTRAYNFGEEENRAYTFWERESRAANLVLVEVDRVKDLKAAYPNYFLDVTKFLAECRMALAGVPTIDMKGIGDLGWLSTWRGRTRQR